MNGKVAVFMQENKLVNSFYECNTITVFEKSDRSGTCSTTLRFEPVSKETIKETRIQTKWIAETLLNTYGCNIIAGKDLAGIPFTVFDTAGFHIFSIEELSDAALDSILEDVEAGDIEKRREEEMMKNTGPVETDQPGIYFLDLVLLQAKRPEVSSKKALKEFLQSTPFLELRLLCKHIPPWIENDGKYRIQSEKSGENRLAVITLK